MSKSIHSTTATLTESTLFATILQPPHFWQKIGDLSWIPMWLPSGPLLVIEQGSNESCYSGIRSDSQPQLTYQFINKCHLANGTGASTAGWLYCPRVKQLKQILPHILHESYILLFSSMICTYMKENLSFPTTLYIMCIHNYIVIVKHNLFIYEGQSFLP